MLENLKNQKEKKVYSLQGLDDLFTGNEARASLFQFGDPRYALFPAIDFNLDPLVAGFLVHLFSTFICGVVAWFSIDFVLTSHEYGDLLLGGVPAWWLQAILPIGFALICYRYFLFSIIDVLELFGMRIREESQ